MVEAECNGTVSGITTLSKVCDWTTIDIARRTRKSQKHASVCDECDFYTEEYAFVHITLSTLRPWGVRICQHPECIWRPHRQLWTLNDRKDRSWRELARITRETHWHVSPDPLHWEDQSHVRPRDDTWPTKMWQSSAVNGTVMFHVMSSSSRRWIDDLQAGLFDSSCDSDLEYSEECDQIMIPHEKTETMHRSWTQWLCSTSYLAP